MSRQTRETLKRYFSAGNSPNESNFADLIDSALNVLDDELNVSREHGLELTNERGHLDQINNLISFFQKLSDRNPLWNICINNESQAMCFLHTSPVDGARTHVLSLYPDGKVKIHGRGDRGFDDQLSFYDFADDETAKKDKIPVSLEVGGAVKAPARVGVGLNSESAVPADGTYHPVTERLSGIQALEVVAKVESRETRQFAIAHAIALNPQNPPWRLLNFWNRSTRIRVHQTFYSGPRDRLQMRWASLNPIDSVSTYRLELKSAFRYPPGTRIHYHVTKLWDTEV